MPGPSGPYAWHGPFLPPPVRVAAFDGKGSGLVADRHLEVGFAPPLCGESAHVCMLAF